jgi:hypothetical protein
MDLRASSDALPFLSQATSLKGKVASRVANLSSSWGMREGQYSKSKRS